MAANDDLLDGLIERDVVLLRVVGGLQNEVEARLVELDAAIAATIATVDPNAVTRPSARRRRQERLIVEINALVTKAFSDINNIMRQGLRRVGRNESRTLSTLIRDVMPEQVTSIGRFNPKEVADEITQRLATQTIIDGAVMRDHWRRLARKTQSAIADEIRKGVRDGLSNQQIVTTVRGGTLDGVARPGVLNTTKNNASAVVRTATNAISNAAREATIANNLTLIDKVLQVSTLDARTSDICIAYSGATWDAETLEPVDGTTLPYNGGPPRHFNCRSTIVPVLKPIDAFPGLEALPSTRRSMDGLVPGDITFDQWLRSKGKTFQDRVLGPGRAKLWRSRKITLTQLVDMRGNPLTLDELEALAGA